jgi:hypothetical protein
MVSWSILLVIAVSLSSPPVTAAVLLVLAHYIHLVGATLLRSRKDRRKRIEMDAQAKVLNKQRLREQKETAAQAKILDEQRLRDQIRREAEADVLNELMDARWENHYWILWNMFRERRLRLNHAECARFNRMLKLDGEREASEERRRAERAVWLRAVDGEKAERARRYGVAECEAYLMTPD